MKVIINKWFNKDKILEFLWSIIRGILVIGICFVILYPILSKISYAFMSEIDLYDKSVHYVPKHFTLDNIIGAWKMMNYPNAFLTSFAFSSINAIFQTFSCTIIAYGFARFNFKFKGIFFAMVITTMVIPPQTILIPLYVNFRGMHLINSIVPFLLLSLTGTALKNGLYIFIMRQFFIGLPKELDEAALVDGCGSFKTLFRIMLPNSIPMMVTIFLFSFVWQWSDIFYTGMLAPEMGVMPQVLNAMIANAQMTMESSIGTSSLIYRLLINSTASILAVVPPLLIFLGGQKYFVEGIERSGIVG